MDIENKSFAVIGGAGLIGSHTIDLLAKENVKEIIVYDNFARGKIENLKNVLQNPKVKIFESGGDILQNDILNSCLKNVDGVFHFAALWLLHCHEFPESAFDVNIRGTFNVMQSCISNKIERLVYSSSASVYGDAITEPMHEDHPFNNKNFYGATKISSEAMLRAFHHRYRLNYVGLRYMNVYGIRQDYKGAYIAVIMKMLDAIDKGENIKIYGDGTEAFDFVDVEDCAKANICAMKSERVDEFYNVGTGIKTTLKQLAESLVKLSNTNVKIDYIENQSKTFVKNRVGSTKLASTNLGFNASISIEKGLKKLIQWRKKHKLAF